MVRSASRDVPAAWGAPADKEVFHLLRGLADTILVGAGTARAENYGPPKVAARLAIVTGFAADRAGRPRLLRRREADRVHHDGQRPRQEGRSGRVAEIIEVGTGVVDLRAALQHLRAPLCVKAGRRSTASSSARGSSTSTASASPPAGERNLGTRGPRHGVGDARAAEVGPGAGGRRHAADAVRQCRFGAVSFVSRVISRSKSAASSNPCRRWRTACRRRGRARGGARARAGPLVRSTRRPLPTGGAGLRRPRRWFRAGRRTSASTSPRP